MTTPGGVPNLPAGGMTLDTLQSMLQDMTPPAMRGRAAQRIPGTYDGSTGGNPLNDLTPFGILTTLFAGFNSHVANADPADIQGPDDLPGLLLDFIESLPVVGQLVGLLEAILGTYDGDDQILLDIQKFFGLFRDLFGLLDGLDLDDLPTVEEVWQTVVTNFIQPLIDLVGAIGDGINAILGPIFNGLDLTSATPAEVWSAVATAFLAPLNLFAIPADVQASINGALGDLQDALDGSYTGSGPIFLAVQALAEAWLKATDPLNAANLFGRISLPQFGSGVPIMALTTAVPNELEPFSSTSVPNVDGWSFNAGQDAAQVVADGSTKTLYLQSGVIKVEAGQPLDTGVSVTYSGVSSSVGQSIRYVLETFTSDDGSGTATPVTVGSVSNPSGTITTPVLLGSSSWAIPAGVQSVRPALVQDLSAGTVFWKNTPTLKKKLAGPLSDGLPKAIQDRIDDLQATWDKFKGSAGGTVDDIEDALDNAGQAIRDALANALGHSGTGHTAANLLTYFQAIPQSVVNGLGDLNTLTNQIRDILAGLVVTPINSTVQAIKDWFTGVVGKTQNLTSGGNLPQNAVSGLPGALNEFSTNFTELLNGVTTGTWNPASELNDLISSLFGTKTKTNQIVEDVETAWTGDTPSGTPTPVYDTITEIKNAVSGIYTMEVKTTSGTWTNPGGIVEFWVLCIGSGDGGSSGAGTASNLFAYGGDSGNTTTSTVGAAGGNYLAQQVNPADLTATVDYTVPAGGAGGLGPTSSPGTPGAAATFGSYASSETVQSASIASILGYYNADASAPGYGGPGGWKTSGGNDFAGKSGKSTPLATGGSFGSPGANGGAGGDASLTGQSRCGGGGGGGGGGNASGKGGNGGAGGFPGGAGGGGGGGLAGSGGGGNGGNGANGAIVLIYR
ncbi:hypothetical protein A5637_13120 [Mycolicibacterium fortuitum]|uniref:glycine-rich domain-containing protein n=1 Tax=Mycolicibacterium fortuitum TaxID=1766 RepID=UPI0007ED72D3|nr:hypothetical protein [Mycolicibacterium fortuitum]OBK04018.1 hypothetical protein A5637_13120 [Mycolicibacterium fortuitum]